jgi:hypothetical protein
MHKDEIADQVDKILQYEHEPATKSSDVPSYVTIFQGTDKLWYGTFYSGGNHKALARTTDGYHNRQDLVAMLSRYFPQFET